MQRIAILIAGCLLVGTAGTTFGQEPQPLEGVSPPPRTVEAAEAEGAKHPKATGTEQTMYADAFGPTDRRCVDADGAATNRTARSGEFVAGPFNPPVFMGSPQQYKRKVWWAPRQGTATPPMQFRAVKVDSPALTAQWSFPSVVWNENGQFYNTLFRLPEVGRWLVVVTAGNNWGCFIVDEVDRKALAEATQAN
jgi:hypothetical protein